VPDDISVIGNHRVDTPFDIPVDLTSFITPWGAMGKRGAELLLSRSKLGEGFSRSVVREIIEPVFYEGKSVRSLS
jgi:DNA-binding LacI/PurR family transcriptional regulator